MKTLVIGGNTGNWNYKEQIGSQYDFNGVETWVFALQGDYIDGDLINLELINQYELVICNLNFDKKKFMKLANSIIKNRNSNIKWVTLIENDALVYLNVKHIIGNLLDNADLVIAINSNSLGYFRMMTNTKVELIGIPYNIENVVKIRKEIRARNNRAMIQTDPLNRINDIMVAEKSGIDFTLIVKNYARKPRNVLKVYKQYGEITTDKEFYLKLIESRLGIEIKNYIYTTTLENFLNILSTHYIALNLDERYTWSRNVLDCAALGIPQVSTKNTEHSAYLFPDLIIENCFAVDHAKELVERLYKDIDFYTKQSNTNLDYFEQYTYSKMKQTLLNKI